MNAGRPKDFEKRKRILRVGCLILAGIFALSMLGSVVMMLLV